MYVIGRVISKPQALLSVFHTSQKWLFPEPLLIEMEVPPLEGKKQKQPVLNVLFDDAMELLRR